MAYIGLSGGFDGYTVEKCNTIGDPAAKASCLEAVKASNTGKEEDSAWSTAFKGALTGIAAAFAPKQPAPTPNTNYSAAPSRNSWVLPAVIVGGVGLTAVLLLKK